MKNIRRKKRDWGENSRANSRLRATLFRTNFYFSSDATLSFFDFDPAPGSFTFPTCIFSPSSSFGRGATSGGIFFYQFLSPLFSTVSVSVSLIADADFDWLLLGSITVFLLKSRPWSVFFSSQWVSISLICWISISLFLGFFPFFDSKSLFVFFFSFGTSVIWILSGLI